LKISNINQDGCWTINSDEEFWDSWREYLEGCDCHEFCLEKDHVIECGYTIKCKPSYDQDLYHQLGDYTTQLVKSPFMTHSSYPSQVIKAFMR
ncbi:hypothetical protein BD408DRAFT_344550, partial [Parasitella parasitica]